MAQAPKTPGFRLQHKAPPLPTARGAQFELFGAFGSNSIVPATVPGSSCSVRQKLPGRQTACAQVVRIRNPAQSTVKPKPESLALHEYCCRTYATSDSCNARDSPVSCHLLWPGPPPHIGQPSTDASPVFTPTIVPASVPAYTQPLASAGWKVTGAPTGMSQRVLPSFRPMSGKLPPDVPTAI